MYELGDVVELTFKIRDPDTGLPPIVGQEPTTVTLTIERPDDSSISYPSAGPITHVPGSGDWLVAYTAGDVGLHQVHWLATGQNAGALDDQFTIEDDYVPFVSVNQQLTHMNAEDTITDPDQIEKLKWYVRVACEAVELDLGRRISPQTVVQTFDGGQTAFMLSAGPVLSVVSLVESGSLIDPTGYVIDTSAGILYRGTTSAPRSFAAGRQNVVLTTRVGQLRPSAVVRKVASNGAQRMWQGSQMPHPAMDDIDAEQQVRTGLLTPLELQAYNQLRGPGFA